MAVSLLDDGVRYWCRARAPDEGGHDIVIRRGEALHPPHGRDEERFLTARWDAFHMVGRTLLRTPVEHAPWELSTATVERCEAAQLFASVGLAAPRATPVAHVSPGVEVRVGVPRRVRGQGRGGCTPWRSGGVRP
jgi:uncharacterized protein YqjF (DUF2071 family)